MDIYEPMGDTLAYRPLLIVAHGGAFVSGTKENEDMVAFCQLFAKRGYITASIEYRMGMNPASKISAERAVYRAIQDGRAAIRFLKEKVNDYRIDTNNVFLLGSSAGAFIALHNAFMNKEQERPAGTYAISHFPPTLDDGPDLGGLDAIASQYAHSARAKAIVSLWGALQDTVLIQPEDGIIPVLLIHGTDDKIVPFDVGSPFNISSFPPTYGSKPISERLEHLGFPYEKYFVQGAGHEFYGVLNGQWAPAPNAYWDTVVTKTTRFLWLQHKPTIDSINVSTAEDTAKFSAFGKGIIKWVWDFGDGTTGKGQNAIHVYNSQGTFTVKVKALNRIMSWDTTSVQVSILAIGIKEQSTIPSSFELNIYPNPFGAENGLATVEYSLPAQASRNGSPHGKVTLDIYDVLGRKITTLFNGILPSGKHVVKFNAANLPSGIYFCRLNYNGLISTRKFAVIK